MHSRLHLSLTYFQVYIYGACFFQIAIILEDSFVLNSCLLNSTKGPILCNLSVLIQLCQWGMRWILQWVDNYRSQSKGMCPKGNPYLRAALQLHQYWSWIGLGPKIVFSYLMTEPLMPGLFLRGTWSVYENCRNIRKQYIWHSLRK